MGYSDPPSTREKGWSEHPVRNNTFLEVCFQLDFGAAALVFSRDGSLRPSSYADVRCIDDVIAF